MGKTLSFEEVNKRLEDNNRPVRLIGPYINGSTKTLFKCLICDWEWDTKPSNVLNKSNCPCCFGTHKSSTEEVNIKLENRNIIMISEYIDANYKESLFRCLICDYEWDTVPSSITCGTGCPKCAKYGFDIHSSATLYYIKINNNDNIYYKIGITNKNANERFLKQELKHIEILSEQKYELGVDAYNKEQEILKEFNEYRYLGENILSTGNTEIFTIDIRELGFQC